MDKEPRPAGCYRAYDALKPANNGNSSTLKRSAGGQSAMGSLAMDHVAGPSKPRNTQVRCLCFGGVPDQASSHSFVKGFFVNLVICSTLVLYTLLGAFIFLYIEGSSELPQQRTLATTAAASGHSIVRRNETWLNQINEARAHTVENLWITTEKLNILYHENWTRLASEQLALFQEQVVRTVTNNLEAAQNLAMRSGHDDVTGKKIVNYEWTFPRSFLYSLTVLTTVGYGIAPRSTLGKMVTMGYAFVGIPLTLIYLSSAGGLLSRCARGVFTRALCCCLCSNCGYCCYDERRMQEKERRMKKRRQQEEQLQQQQQLQLQEPFYVRANVSTYPSSVEIKATSPKDEVSSLSSGDRPNVTILAPISICLGAMFCYIMAGAFTLHKLLGWNFIDASYFCFMCLSTVGFGDMVPGSYPLDASLDASNATLWFCSCYIMSGMALTAMCFNILHDEIVHRLAHQQQQLQQLPDKPEPLRPSASVDELSADPFAMSS